MHSSAPANVAVNVPFKKAFWLLKHGVNQSNIADTCDEITLLHYILSLMPMFDHKVISAICFATLYVTLDQM